MTSGLTVRSGWLRLPIVALAIGWVLLGEHIQLLTLVGFGIIIAGFVPLESREISAELVKYRSLYR